MTANLCKCNKCDTVMIDQNPQTGAKRYDEKEMPENVTEMQFKEDKEGGYWVCPVCDTDDFLNDL